MKSTTIFIRPWAVFLLPLSILLTQCQTPTKIIQQTEVFSKEEQTNLTPD